MIKNNYVYALRDIESGKLLNANSKNNKFYLNKKYALQALTKYNNCYYNKVHLHFAELVIFKLVEVSEEDS